MESLFSTKLNREANERTNGRTNVILKEKISVYSLADGFLFAPYIRERSFCWWATRWFPRNEKQRQRGISDFGVVRP